MKNNLLTIVGFFTILVAFVFSTWYVWTYVSLMKRANQKKIQTSYQEDFFRKEVFHEISNIYPHEFRKGICYFSLSSINEPLEHITWKICEKSNLSKGDTIYKKSFSDTLYKFQEGKYTELKKFEYCK